MKVSWISDKAVLKKTGRGWDEWLRLLDRIGADRLPHKEIARHLYEKEGLDGWWAQMISVGYEQARGLREKYQKPGGYEVSISKTLSLSINKVYEACIEENVRKAWLPELGLQVGKATPQKSIRAVLSDRTRVNFMFYGQGEGKCQVVVQHTKLTDSTSAESSRSFWRTALERLKAHCESQ